MIVIYKNGLYHCDMDWLLFYNLNRVTPFLEVEIYRINDSSYKELKKVPIREVEDYSVVRNLVALGIN